MRSSAESDPSSGANGGAPRGMADRVRDFDFATTPLGPKADWPQSLRTAVRIMLSSRYAMWMAWGPELTFLCNDAYAPTLGIKREWALGAPARQVWAEVWDAAEPRIEHVLRTGEATWDEGLLLFLERSGYPEETYHTFSYSPLQGDDGRISGMLCVVTEETDRVIGARRLGVLRDLAALLALANTEREVWAAIEQCPARAHADLPFVEIHLTDANAPGGTRLVATNGARGRPAATSEGDGDGAPSAATWPLAEVLRTGAAAVVPLARTAAPPGSAWPRPAERAVILPIAERGNATTTGCLVAGITPHRPFDDGYRSFLDLFVSQIAAALANARAYEQERRRAESLAELDRAKTAFFSNVSHEFRTPLTLMLGPLEDTLDDTARLPERALESLRVVHRNGLRLLKLVNTLLDFSRIEAGRVDAAFEPTDLAALTIDLASAFRSATDRAGLRLEIDAPRLAEPVFVDRDMWEKIVLNLLSNAFKFTLAGGITVRLRRTGDAVELTVRDTGSGIPAAELPHVFERFHRVAGTRGRTHEGTGIGLALVRELVQLHGGAVRAESAVDVGSTFTVTVPLGSGHLPPAQIRSTHSATSTALGATPFVEEALRWVPASDGAPTAPPGLDEAAGRPRPAPGGAGTAAAARERIVVADDNADMRDYLRTLLAPSYTVIAVADGRAALLAARATRPALILTDVMMPDVDGFELLRLLRSDPELAGVPVIMLSARAGEEATLEGIEAGADDYLVKPFSARELKARVTAQIERNRLQRRIASTEQRLAAALAAARMAAWEWDPERDVVSASATIGDVLGLPAGAQPGGRDELLAMVHPDDAERRRAALDAAVRTRSGSDHEFRIVRPSDGRVAWLEERCRVTDDPVTKRARVVALVADVTTRKEAEAALRRSEERARFLVELDDALRAMTDPAAMAAAAPRLIARHLDCSRALYVEIEPDQEHCAVTGEYSPRLPSVAGRYRITDYGEDYAAAVRDNRPYVEHDTTRATLPAIERERFAALGVGAFVAVPIFKAGRFVAMLVIHDEAPRVWQPHEIEQAGLAGNRCWESIERARAANALAQSEERLNISVQAGELGTFYCPLPFGELVWNDTCKEHFFLPPDAEVTIERFFAILHEDDRAFVQSALQRAIERGEPYDVEYRTVAPDGRVRWLRARGKAYYAAAGNPVRFDGVTLDVSALKAAERLREKMLLDERAAREEAERVNRMKDEFLATLSHELRTPLNAILGWSQVLSGGAREAPVVDQGLAAIERNARAQTQMIEDLLDMSRIVSGKMRLDVQTVSLPTIVEQAVLSVRPMADGRGVRLTTVLDPGAGPVAGDPGRLQQVVWNLLTNAIKFTPRGGQVQVVLERVNSHLEVAVADTGEGIDPAFLPHIFGRFQQADASTTRRHGGLGLGLSIVKQLIELHGGTVRVKSPGKGRGSTFTIHLPLAVSALGNGDHGLGTRQHPATARADAGKPALPSLEGVAVLVVDDDGDARELMRRILTTRGAEVTTTDSVAAALAAIRQRVPAVLVSDIGMPDHDGYELIRAVRALPAAAGGRIPAIALTAFARSEDRQRTLLAGYQMHVAKPVEPAELIAACASLAGCI